MNQPDPTEPEQTSAPDIESDADSISAPDSEERRANLAAAIADVEAGVRAETYDTDGENTEA